MGWKVSGWCGKSFSKPVLPWRVILVIESLVGTSLLVTTMTKDNLPVSVFIIISEFLRWFLSGKAISLNSDSDMPAIDG